MAQYDLCLQRKTINTYKLEKCNNKLETQMVLGYDESAPFELHPISDLDKCIVNHHHPKPAEWIESRWCISSRRAKVNFWKVYRDEKAGHNLLKIRSPVCNERNKCNVCEGDCDSSRDCQGNLVCRQRHKDDGLTAVPGCIGLPIVSVWDFA